MGVHSPWTEVGLSHGHHVYTCTFYFPKLFYFADDLGLSCVLQVPHSQRVLLIILNYINKQTKLNYLLLICQYIVLQIRSLGTRKEQWETTVFSGTHLQM